MLKSNSTTLQKTKNITLSIQFSLGGFSFCISNTDTQKKVLFKDYPFKNLLNTPEELLESIKPIFNEDDNLQLEFTEVNVIHQNSLSTIVPEAFFNENLLSAYLNHTIKTLRTDFITFDDIPKITAKNVYIPYVNINNFLFQNFGEFNYQHHSTVLIDKLLSINTSDKKMMYVNIYKNTFDIVIIHNKKLVLSNSFSYLSKEDFIYYLLFVAEQNQLDTNQFQLYFLGDVSKKSELYSITYKYIKNIQFLESDNSIYRDLKLPTHSNFILLG
ncbi:DUF3822 family protein [Polaribacter sp. R77954]|uniref:DUF3822 family protein n=1 Tax=Polaribacter sp. R77954 TaxID=3093870 RepID=UPI0037C94D83